MYLSTDGLPSKGYRVSRTDCPVFDELFSYFSYFERVEFSYYRLKRLNSIYYNVTLQI